MRTWVIAIATAATTALITHGYTRTAVYDEYASFLRVECPHLVIDAKRIK